MNPNPNDATSLLIQRVLNQLPPQGTSAQAFSTSFLSQFNTFIANMASYAQILSVAEAPLAQALAEVVVGDTVADVAAAAAGAAAAASVESTALGAAAASGAVEAVAASGAIGGAAGTIGAAAASGYGAAIVLIVAAALAAIVGSSDAESSQEQQLQSLSAEIAGIQNVVLKTYWLDTLTPIMNLWGPVQTDLNNIASEGIARVGTGGDNPDVTGNVSHFHDDAMTFVDSFIPAMTLGAAEQDYWQRPVVPDQLFSAQPVNYPAVEISFGGGGPIEPVPGGSPVNSYGAIVGWYGLPPQGPTQNPSQQTALDPHTMLPFLLVGIQSYLTIQTLIHFIDSSLLKFSDFLKDFRGGLKDYASFISSQYTLIINGIIKSDIPQPPDVLSFLYFIAVSAQGGSFPDDTRQWGGSKPGYMGAWVGAGDAWNGVYGAVDKYPTYGAYNPSPPVPVPFAAPAYIVDILNTSNLGAELQQLYAVYIAAPPGPVGNPSPFDQFVSWLNWWTIPWTIAKVILGTMARWKAIYLFNGYDKVWSTIQNLQILTRQPLLPTPRLTQDGTIANGNWSARELIGFISSINALTYPIPDTDPAVAQTNTSLLFLVQALDAIVKGNWAGPPSFSSSGGVPSRPLGFRDRLAAAAV